MRKTIISLLLTATLFGGTAGAAQAMTPIDWGSTDEGTAAVETSKPLENVEGNPEWTEGWTVPPLVVDKGGSATPEVARDKALPLPSGYGTLTSNAWRKGSNPVRSGNGLTNDYQVSAVYSGGKTVEKIRTTWYGTASMRNSASFTLGLSSSGVTYGSSSSWQSKSTPSKYWENTNGAKTSSYRSNMTFSPYKDYRSDTLTITNTAKLKIKGDSRTWSTTAIA